MQLSSEFSGQLVRVKLEPPDVPCLPEEGQTQQQHCNQSSSGGDADGAAAGMCDIKEEPQEDSSNEHPIIEVKTEPYNVAILAGQEQMGQSCHSTSEGAKESTGMLRNQDQTRSTCDQASSSCTFSNAQLQVSTTIAEPQVDNTPLVIMDSQPTEQPTDQARSCALACTATASPRCHMFARSHNESEKCPATSSLRLEMGEEGFARETCPSALSVGHENHVSKHTDQKLWKCYCPEQLRQSTSLWCHRQAHIGAKTYKCDLCAVEFSHSGLLQHHKRTHAGEKPYKCDVCPAEFGQKRHLQDHKRTHTGEKPYKCDVCPAEFSQKGHLHYHKRTHTGEKPFKCDVCSAKFSQSGNLQFHKRTHTGEKPYKCDVCPAEFSRRGNLQGHKQTHTGEKPYKCNLCPAEFIRSTDLRRHKRTHTGEKPYKCDICPAEFRQSGHLHFHKRTHMGEMPYKCDVCPSEFSQNWNLQDQKRTRTCETPYSTMSVL
ncbi:zinc finger protein 235-like isoform X5 [Ornithodoros turicata]|uniref:zinc finger protein 235-like isoform X5 n=1 Tax=Ornithodoros turicata TaxID=34597 RepID=UPI003139C7E4